VYSSHIIGRRTSSKRQRSGALSSKWLRGLVFSGDRECSSGSFLQFENLYKEGDESVHWSRTYRRAESRRVSDRATSVGLGTGAGAGATSSQRGGCGESH
jgi:hypothetical protein